LDDGDTLAYEHGESLRVHFSCSLSPSGIQIDIAAAQGPYQPWFKDLQILVYGLSAKPSSVELDGKPLSTWNHMANAASLSGIPWTRQAHTIRLNLGTN